MPPLLTRSYRRRASYRTSKKTLRIAHNLLVIVFFLRAAEGPFLQQVQAFQLARNLLLKCSCLDHDVFLLANQEHFMRRLYARESSIWACSKRGPSTIVSSHYAGAPTQEVMGRVSTCINVRSTASTAVVHTSPEYQQYTECFFSNRNKTNPIMPLLARALATNARKMDVLIPSVCLKNRLIFTIGFEMVEAWNAQFGTRHGVTLLGKPKATLYTLNATWPRLCTIAKASTTVERKSSGVKLPLLLLLQRILTRCKGRSRSRLARISETRGCGKTRETYSD